ncbi:Arf-domain-containing protein [Violaceomyces palustris]|uniref:Arf-domain-containing protein n=1 Tax=Violaceomyces palustris TaxID=1673888 RepID=A0ACD0P2S9_9BASI|nr:Arf-domain-containing protein [Violaceomyces palustris]
MGVAFSSLWSSLFGSKELKICILGLDNAGKTTLMYKMTLGSVVSTAPTVGSNTETFEYKNLKFMLWDVGGQTSLRSSWSSYLAATDAVIFVLDSNDRDRVHLAKEELHRIGADEQVAKAPILVWANKQDIKGSMSPAEISEALGLTAFRERTWQIFGCSALTGKGLTEGLDWLAHTLGAKGFSYDQIKGVCEDEVDTPTTTSFAKSLSETKLEPAGSETQLEASDNNTIEPQSGQSYNPTPLIVQAHTEQTLLPEEESKIQSDLSKHLPVANDFMVRKNSKEACKNWDKFYKNHQDRFFKDRHWTTKEFGPSASFQTKAEGGKGGKGTPTKGETSSSSSNDGERGGTVGEEGAEESALVREGLLDGEEPVLLEVGCGVGNMLFPLIESSPKLKVHCCDFSPRAIDLVKAHPSYDPERINAFVHDLTNLDPGIRNHLFQEEPYRSWSKPRTISMIFVLSAIPPDLHRQVLSSLVELLPEEEEEGAGLVGPQIILRDYARGDLSQLRFHNRPTASWSEPSLLSKEKSWYRRGDNTFNYFFTVQELEQLASSVGLKGEVRLLNRVQVNRRTGERLVRRFVQARWVRAKVE